LVVADKDPLDLDSGSHAHYQVLLGVLQSMCEGNNKLIQDYLMNQPDNIKNFNLVQLVTSGLAILVQESPIHRDSVPLIAQSVSTLTEFCQGNLRNQRNAFDNRVFDCLNVMLRVENGEVDNVDRSANTKKDHKKAENNKATSREREMESLFMIYSRDGYLHEKSDKSQEGFEKLCKETNVPQYQMQSFTNQKWIEICRLVAADTDVGLTLDDFKKWCHSKFAAGAVFTIDANGAAVFDENVVQMHLCAAELLGRMLETNNDETRYLAHQIDGMLELPVIVRLFREYSALGGIGGNADYVMTLPVSGEVKCSEIAFAVYNVLVRLQDFTGKAYHRDPYLLAADADYIASHGGDMGTKSFTTAYEEMDENTAVVEVMVGGVLEQVHFAVKKQWKIDAADRESLLWSVERGAVTEQVADFMVRSKEIAANMKHSDRFRENTFYAALIESNSVLDWAFMFWTFIVNLAMIVTWVAPHERDSSIPVIQIPFTRHSDVDGSDDNAVIIMQIFGYIHVALTGMMLFSFYLTHPPSWYYEKEQDKPTAPSQIVSVNGKLVKAKVTEVDIIRELRAAHFIDEKRDMRYLPIISSTSFYYMFMMACSVLGVMYHGYTFAFCLLHITRGNDILSRVLSSVTQNGVSLLYVALLLMIIIYIYALAGFAYYREFYDREEGNFCYTMVQCFFTSLRLGLLSGGGLGDAFGYNEAVPAYAFHTSGMPAGRILFDISFFVLVTIIGLNVVFGIIVDTFSELREEKGKTEEKMQGECFVCGLKSNTFDRFGNGWQHHIKKEHHMWDYLYLIRHFDEKDASEFTFLEQYVAEKIYRDENDFYPFGRSLAMPRGAPGGDPVGSAKKRGGGNTTGGGGGGSSAVDAAGGGAGGAGADTPTMEKMMAMIVQQNQMIASLHAKFNITDGTEGDSAF